MEKRMGYATRGRHAQISIYLIMGMFIIVAGAVFITLHKQKTRISMPADLDTTALEAFVQSCIDETTIDGIYLLGNQAGYFELPEPHVQYLAGSVPYLITPEKQRKPSVDGFAQQLGMYITQTLSNCTKHFANFTELNIEEQPLLATAIFTAETIEVQIEYPLTIKKGNTQKELRTWGTVLPSHIFNLVSMADNIVTLQQTQGSTLCLSCFANLAEEYNATLDLVTKGNDTIIFIATDHALEEHFSFAALFPYPFDQKFAPSSQDTLSITPIAPQTARVGMPFTLTVSTNKPALLQDYTSLFDINAVTGTIRFTPTAEQVGMYDIILEAKTQEGEEDFIHFPLEVRT